MRRLFITRSCGGRRHAQRERGAAARRALELDRAAVQRRALLDDRQAEAGALYVADVAAAVEGAEQLRLVLGRNADALVADPERERILGGFQRERHLALGRRVLERVRQQVAHGVAQQLLVE